MGRRKDQDAVYRERIRSIPVELYPLLLARAQRPFSTEDTTPFKVTGKHGDKYVTVAYRPNRNTKLSLGPPNRIPDILGSLGFSNATSAAQTPSVDLPQALSTVRDQTQTDQSVISFNDNLPHNFMESAGSAKPSVSLGQASSDPAKEKGVVKQADQVPPRLKPRSAPAIQASHSDLPHDERALLNSYWKLPSVCTLAMGLIFGVAEMLFLASTKRPTSAFAAQSADLPHGVPSIFAAVRNDPASVSTRNSPQALLPQPIKAEPLSTAARSKLTGLFAELCAASAHDQVVENDNGVDRVSVQVDGAHSYGRLLEQYLFQSEYSSSAQEDGIRKLIRTGVTQVSIQKGVLRLAIRDVAAYRLSIVDKDDPSRTLSGLGVGRLWLEFKAEHIEVTEVSP